MTVEEAAQHAQDGRNEGLRMAVLDELPANDAHAFLYASPATQRAIICSTILCWTPQQRGLYFQETP